MQTDVFGKAITDFYNNSHEEDIKTFSSLKEEDVLPVAYLFRDFSTMPDLEKAALQYEARCKHLDKTQQAEEKMQEIFFRGQRRNQLVKAAKARALLSAKSCQQIERHSDNALLRKGSKTFYLCFVVKPRWPWSFFKRCFTV